MSPDSNQPERSPTSDWQKSSHNRIRDPKPSELAEFQTRPEDEVKDNKEMVVSDWECFPIEDNTEWNWYDYEGKYECNKDNFEPPKDEAEEVKPGTLVLMLEAFAAGLVVLSILFLLLHSHILAGFAGVANK